MGRDKAFLPADGKPFVERLLAVLHDCFQQLLLAGDRPERFEPYQVPVVPDIYPGSSLGGLYTALQHAETDRVFVTSCDMPFISPDIIRLICSCRGKYDAVVPATERGLEPLCALYAKSCLPVMQQALQAGNYRITAVLQQLEVQYLSPELLQTVDPVGRGLININTPEEYAACRGGAS